MAIRKETIGQQLKRITKFKTLDRETGMLYAKKADLTRKRKKITMVGLFVSKEGTFLVRPHLFVTKKAGKDARAWDAWLAEHYGSILRDFILPVMDERTDKSWRLYRIVGWLGNDNTRLVRTKIREGRNKTKRARG